MRATRYRLRWLRGIAEQSVTYGSGYYGTDTYGQILLPDAFYGSAEYGSNTYGQTASDPLTALTFEAIPWTGGFPTAPSWLYRAGDTLPAFEARILGDGEPADIAFVKDVELVLTPADGRDDSFQLTFQGSVVQSTKGLMTVEWEPGDLDQFGVYRCLIRLTFGSGRRLTVPVEDRHTFVILDENRSDVEFGRYGAGRFGTNTYGAVTIT